MSKDSDSGGSAPSTETSFRIARARSGDADSVAWLVSRFSPALMVQAKYRLGVELRTFHDAEDLVADVWMIALPRLGTLKVDPGHDTPTLLRFLGTTLMYRVNNLVRKHIRGGAAVREADLPRAGDDSGVLERIAADTTGAVTRAVRGERQAALDAALDELDPEDREVLILRGIEQSPNHAVAIQLGLPPNTVSHRYVRALRKLRGRLPDSVLAELSDD